MTTHAIETVVARLSDAGLNLALAPAGGLAVAPSSHLNADLRELIRSSKAQLIDWLMASKGAESHIPGPPDNPAEWKELAAAYYSHHHQCRTCIAAGRGKRYGRRCAIGTALWNQYTWLCNRQPEGTDHGKA